MLSLAPRAGIFAFALATVFGVSSPAAAAGLLQPVPTAEAAGAASEGSEMGNLVRRSRVVRLDTSELARHVAPLNADTAADRIERSRALDGIIPIELFPGTTAIFKRHSVDEIGDSGYAWVGRVKNSPGNFASLIVDNNEVTGHIQLLHRLFQIEPLSNGLHRVIEINPANFPPDDPPHRSENIPEHGGLLEKDTLPTEAVTTIRVLAAYTNAARNTAGSVAKITNEIKQGIALANQAYANTGIPIKVVLARVMAAGAYVENQNIDVDLNRLDGTTPGFLQNVRNMRNTIDADLVSLWRKADPSGFCGIGNLTDRPGANTKNLAYHVMTRTCLSNLSFHHEMGHNMGLRHDYYVDPTPGVRYNHGYVNRTAACRIRTVMGYNNDCTRSGFSCTRINGFSTGSFRFNTGSAQCVMGQTKSGTLKRMDNTQRLKETRGAISRYR